MKKYILIFIGVFILTFTAKAQNGLENILIAGIDDANKLGNAYINPAMKGFTYAMNNGWYHTAKVHKVLGIDVTVGVSAAIVPQKDESFTFASLGLSSLITSTPTSSPTLAGTVVPPSDIVKITIPANTFQDVNGGNHPALTSEFNMPDGFKDELPIDATAIPAPSVQVGIGLPFKSEVIVRFFPETKTGDLNAGMYGVGLKKEITSLFGLSDNSPFHLSLFGNYTKMNLDYDIQQSSAISGSNQRAEFTLDAYSVEAIASLNFPIINIYGGIGYGNGTTKTDMLGSYIIEYETGQPAPDDKVTRTLTDPVSLKSTSAGMKTNIGARLSLGFFKIFASYTLQEYNTINAGVAISIR